MNDTPNGAGAAAPAPQPPSQGIDPAQFQAELERVRAENQTLRSGLEQLRPFAEDIEWITQDPENQKFLRESRKAYEQARKAATAVPHELEPLAKDIGDIKGFVEEFKAQQAYAAQEPRRRWLLEGKTFAESLMAKHPELSRTSDPTMSWAGALQNISESRGLSWDEAWKILAPAFVKPSSGPMPTSSRADTGFAGLPPPAGSAQNGNGQAVPGKKLGQIVLERMQSTAQGN